MLGPDEYALGGTDLNELARIYDADQVGQFTR